MRFSDPGIRIAGLKARLAQLCAENEALRARADELEAALTADLDIWRLVDLTPSERLLVGFLVRRGVASRDGLYQVLYGGRSGEVEPKIIDVFVCRLRVKLAPLDVVIETVRALGYRLRPGDAAKITRAMETLA